MRGSFISIAILSLGALPLAAAAASRQPDHGRIVAGLNGVTIEPARRVRGKDLHWDHEIQVALPASYGKTDQSYPVLWLTDGSLYFELAAKAVNYDLKQYLPEMIVVAVGAPPEELGEFVHRRSYEFSPTRDWGFTGPGAELFDEQLTAAEHQRKAAGEPGPQLGGAAKFLAFLVDELRPALSVDYRMANEHVLFGDSAGGLFCTYALLARTEAFSRYICGSPPLYTGNFDLFRMEERYAKEHDDLKATVFFGAGEAEILDRNARIRAWGIVSSTARMAEILSLRGYPSLKLHARIFADESHASVAPLNLSGGLRAVWKDGAAR